ncbi:hypothetical protein [Thalassotalea piscium]|uniref:Uncharacterized protein n=1 Tax=Thalassotalea piscium TaxID=1230533 RepID=A0A7X0TTV6_9GAMM|nr:hypothetical protein [Thalassotalea piscium]MBB6543553.1 hypothetical protein [Thalassotalea piscium]
MNQKFLINDDFHFNSQFQAWVFTAMYSGSLLTFVVKNSAHLKSVTLAIQFDWEENAEAWLENNELDDDTLIYI